jgi:hypothetical protein
MLTGAGLKEKIDSALKPLNESISESYVPAAGDYLRAWGNAFLSYVTDNTEITYVWTATTVQPGSPPVVYPDPVIEIKAKLTGTGLLVPSDTREQFLSLLTSLVLSLDTVSADVSFSVPLVLNPLGVITADFQAKPGDKPTYDETMTHFCEQVIESFKTFINPATISGTHTALGWNGPSTVYTGVANGMVLQ